jgi:hypothetical protein
MGYFIPIEEAQRSDMIAAVITNIEQWLWNPNFVLFPACQMIGKRGFCGRFQAPRRKNWQLEQRARGKFTTTGQMKELLLDGDSFSMPPTLGFPASLLPPISLAMIPVHDGSLIYPIGKSMPEYLWTPPVLCEETLKGTPFIAVNTGHRNAVHVKTLDGLEFGKQMLAALIAGGCPGIDRKAIIGLKYGRRTAGVLVSTLAVIVLEQPNRHVLLASSLHNLALHNVRLLLGMFFSAFMSSKIMKIDAIARMTTMLATSVKKHRRMHNLKKCCLCHILLAVPHKDEPSTTLQVLWPQDRRLINHWDLAASLLITSSSSVSNSSACQHQRCQP